MPNSIFDVKDFGAIGDGITNDSSAFQLALNAIAALSKIARAGFPNTGRQEIEDPSGAVLWVPRGQYQLSQPLNINRQLMIQGVGPTASILEFPSDKDGIVINSTYTSEAEKDTIKADGTPNPYGHGRGGGTAIRDLGIIGGSQLGLPNSPNPAINENDPLTALPKTHTGHAIKTGHGIVLCETALIDNCQIQNFHYDGIHIETIDTIGDFTEETHAPYSGTEAGKHSTTKNANGWHIRNCLVRNNGRHGIFAAGINSNAGVVVGVLCQGNSGWGVYDRSQHGNTYVACTAEANGHFAKDVRVLLMDAEVPATLYAGTADAGAFISRDGGESWSAINVGLGDFEVIPVVQALAIEPRKLLTAPYVLYAGTNGGRLIDGIGSQNRVVFQSKDGGKIWQGVGSDRNGLTTSDVRTLVMDVNTRVLYAGTFGGGVFKGAITLVATGADNINWSPVNTGLSNLSIQVLAIQPATSAILYAGTNGGGVFKTTDAGASWNLIGLGSSDVRAILIDPLTPTTLYAATAGGGVFKSLDAGVNWQAVNKGLSANGQPISNIRALVMDLSTPTTLYAGTNAHGIFKSIDGAASWHAINTGLPDPATVIQTLALDSSDPSIIYAGTSAGLFRLQQTLDKPAWVSHNPFYGGSHKTIGPNAGNVLLGCYSEGDQVYGSELAGPTLLLGGTNGGGFNFTTEGGIIATAPGGNRIIGLTLRGPIAHAVGRIASKAPNVAHSITTDVLLVDAAAGNITIVLPAILPPASDISGRQFTIKKVDSTTNKVLIRPLDNAKVDDVLKQDIPLTVPHSGVSVVATPTGWQIVGRF